MFDRLDPKVDFVFKRIFGVEENKDVLLDFLIVTLRESEPRPLTDIQILNPYIDKCTPASLKKGKNTRN